MIKANLAGTCYPAQRKELLPYIRGWFDRPDSVPWAVNGTVPHAEPRYTGVIAPHIDFRINTAVYARAFEEWLTRPPADKVLILGVGHRARQEWSIDDRSYATPLGEIHTDAAGLKTLRKQLPPEIWDDATAHAREHSIEFPLICLQALRELRGIETPFEFIPVLCGGLFEYLATRTFPAPDAVLYRIAKALREWWDAAVADGKRVELIVSIDGCHMGPRFGHRWEIDEPKRIACAEWEEILWKRVAQGNIEKFLKLLQRDGNIRYFDGVGALALVMAMFPGEVRIHRTGYAQWYEERDTSLVTFSSGNVMEK